MRRLVIAVLASLILLPPLTASAQDRGYLPERRSALAQDVDFYGSDLTPAYDVTFESCRRTCLADATCKAFTYNSRASSCFPKSAVSDRKPYQGAISGVILETREGAVGRAKLRAGDLGFLKPEDFDAALDQARRLADDYITGDTPVADLLAAAMSARGAGDWASVALYTGAAANLNDGADQWADYADALLRIPASDTNPPQESAARATAAAVNAYLRARDPAQQATALATLAQALQRTDRGRDSIPALRLAETLQPRDDTAAALAGAIAKYGFNLTDTSVEADSASPRICAIFNEDLLRGGTDYATFVKLPGSGLSVEATDRQICVAGVEHGKRYQIGFRQGLPGASGETLQKDVTVTLYVRDRSPAVRFPGRAYVLPRSGSVGVPVETVNTGTLDLRLLRLSDRNLVRTFREDLFARPLDYWSGEVLQDQLTETVWSGTAEVAMEINRDMTTHLPLDAVLPDLGPGIYALQASLPGRDPADFPPATQWIVVSDLGLTTLSGTDGVHVFVRALGDAGAVEGATVTLVSRANAVIATATTDAEGHALFAANYAAGSGGAAPALVTVAKDDDLAFLSLSEAEFDLSDRGVAGREAAPPIDVFLATDRGAYRAGETVNATILARDPKIDALDGLPMSVRLLRPDGVEYTRMLTEPAGAGGSVATLRLAGNAPRGTWRIESFVEDGRILASSSFLVEDFLPERIDFTLTLPEGPLPVGGAQRLAVDARYLFGAPGAGLDAEGELRLAAASRLDGFPGYQFGRQDETPPPVREPLAFAAATDAAGHVETTLPAPDLGETVTGPLAAEVVVRLKEGSGRPVERRIERTLLPDAPVLGIKARFADGTVPQGAEAGFDLIAVGPDGKPAARQVTWTLNRLETSYQWYSLYGQWNWEPTTTRSRVATGSADLTPAAPVAISAPVDWGRYELVVESADGPYSAASVSFYAGWYVPADAAETPDTLTVALDKEAYRPGDTARLKIDPRAAGIALVTVLSNHLIAMKAVPVTLGENVIELPVTDEWGAGAYVTASVIRPLDTEAGRAPGRALGLSYAPVDPGPRRLAASFETADAVDPRGPLPVALKVEGASEGEEVHATIAAVDLGILNLTGFTAPDPEGHYFGQQKLGVAIRDLYGRLIDGQAGVAGAVRSGGDAAAGLKMQAPPPTEELVAYFSGPLTVGADGYARTDFDLPSFNGTVRLMAIVWSKTAIGQAEKDVLVRDPVVVTASVPRFLAPGDQSRLLLEIVHATGPAGRAGLDVTGDGVMLGARPGGVDLTEGGKASVSIPLAAGATAGTATIRVALTTPGGKQLLKTLTIPVAANDPVIMRQSRFDLAAGAAFTLDANVFAGLVPGTGRATLAAGPVARFDAPGLLATLDAYPYGCTEQLASKALPLLYFEDLAETVGQTPAADLRKRVEGSIAEILLNQSSNGAFGLWYPESGDLWLDAYVTDFLSRARAQGFAVPDAAFRSALDNLRNQINYAPDFDEGGGPYAYALMVLAREGAAAVGDLRYYADVKQDAFDTPIAAAQLGAALASYGDQTRADAMFAAAARLIAGEAPEEPRLWRADYGTRLRDATAVLALAAESGSQAVDSERLGTSVAASLAGRRLSTQEATWALLATHALIDRAGVAGLTVNGAPVSGPLVRVLDAEAAAPQIIANGSDRIATVTLTTFGVPSEPEPAGGKGYRIARSYYTLDGAPADISDLRQGTRLVAVIEVTPLDGGEARLMVNDPLPAGFEIDNPSLLRAGDIAALDWLETAETRMTEFRQDRFLAAVDLTSPDPFRLAYIVRAISPGTFRQPAASVEDMYRPEERARTAAGMVTVTE
ncbi:MAG: alpha-2-macroglobulin family protein [Defluviimonas sp.]|uniref:alpha-2-macroglobulin family protein n=1 Tax=Albidovulum sp. TaxID=1872424 RepID=UPI002A2C8061|nr:alpha-2-macroglobulin family protein [Defluviimonas sp.]